MKKQIIIAISREYGSGGRDIGEYLARELNIPMYDRSIIREIAEEMNMDPEVLMQFDEKPRNLVKSRQVKGYSNSMEDILNEKQADWIRRKAKTGESFVIVGRRGKETLRGHEGLITIFITGDHDYKVGRIMEYCSLSESEAKSELVRVDRIRRAYHNRFSDEKWGDSRYYDLIINASRLGAEKTAEEVLHYINARIEAMEG